MSATLLCPFCKSETSDEHNFCVACDKQIRCLNADCSKLLLPGKTFCFSCGFPLSMMTAQPQRTKYVRRVKQKGNDYSEYTELDVAESVAIAWAPMITGQIMGKPPQRQNQQPKPQEAALIEPPTAFTDGLFAEDPGVIEQAVKNSQLEQAVALSNDATHYFKPDGEYLVAMTKDYKGKSWADQQRHFILLYASAYYKLFGKAVPSKEHFKVAAEKASVIDDSNFTKYLSKLVQHGLSEMGGGYVVNTDGEKEVERIVSLIESPTAEKGNEYWSRSASDIIKRPRLNNDDKERIILWIQETVDLGQLDIRSIKRSRDYGLLALWIITVHLGKAETVSWNEAFFFLEKKYTAVSASREAFHDALLSSSNEEHFREASGRYFLTTAGVTKVEGWLTGRPVEAASDEEKK